MPLPRIANTQASTNVLIAMIDATRARRVGRIGTIESAAVSTVSIALYALSAMIGRKPTSETIAISLPRPGTSDVPTSFIATSASAACSFCASHAPRPIIQVPDSDAPAKITAISFARRVFFGR